MLAHLKKVFWTQTDVVECDGGFGITLDDRRLRSPEKADFVLPAHDLAQAVAAEWQAQDGEIVPASMPFTRLCNAAIDKMPAQIGSVVDMLTSYGETDLLAHRATSPDALIARQAAAWDPVLAWMADHHQMPLNTTHGVIPVDQPDETLARLRSWVSSHDTFSIMALHDLVTISGSIGLSFAVCQKHLSPPDAWPLSRIDETWQAEQWGEDAEAVKTAQAKATDFNRAAAMYHMLEVRTAP